MHNIQTFGARIHALASVGLCAEAMLALELICAPQGIVGQFASRFCLIKSIGLSSKILIPRGYETLCTKRT
jgi:hypothetical protein